MRLNARSTKSHAMSNIPPDLYERVHELALAQASAFGGEPTHTKLVSRAGRLIELGREEQAEACLRYGRAEAIRRSGTFWIEETDRLLQQLAA
jgi:hypothetical protein